MKFFNQNELQVVLALIFINSINVIIWREDGSGESNCIVRITISQTKDKGIKKLINMVYCLLQRAYRQTS